MICCQHAAWVDDWCFLGADCAHYFSCKVVPKCWFGAMTYLACEAASRLKTSKATDLACGDLLWLRRVRWGAWFSYLFHSQWEGAVLSLSIGHTPPSLLPFLASGKAEFCPKRRLPLSLCTDKLTMVLSNNHYLILGTFILWDQKECFILCCAM